jgi:hypothetical protein
MAGALIYEIFDIHDTKPFYTDPECLLMLHSCVLIFCIGIAALTRALISLSISLSGFLPLGPLRLLSSSAFRQEKFEIEHLLFSPPPGMTSLRI